MSYAVLHPDCDVLTAPEVEDLARVAADPKLPGLIIFRYKFESLRELKTLSGHLRVLKISGAYARLAQALPNAKGRCLSPYCPKCNSRLLSAHVAKWEQLTGRPSADSHLEQGTQ